MTEELELRQPAKSDRAAVEKYKREMLENGGAAIDGGVLTEQLIRDGRTVDVWWINPGEDGESKC